MAEAGPELARVSCSPPTLAPAPRPPSALRRWGWAGRVTTVHPGSPGAETAEALGAELPEAEWEVGGHRPSEQAHRGS